MMALPPELREYCFSLGITRGIDLREAVAKRPRDTKLLKAYAIWAEAVGRVAMSYGM